MQQVIVLLFVFHQLKAVWPFSSEDNTKYCRLLDIFMFFQCFSASSMDGPVGKFQWSEIFSQAHLAPTIFQNLKSPFFLIQIFALNYNRSSWPRQNAFIQSICFLIWVHSDQFCLRLFYLFASNIYPKCFHHAPKNWPAGLERFLYNMSRKWKSPTVDWKQGIWNWEGDLKKKSI